MHAQNHRKKCFEMKIYMGKNNNNNKKKQDRMIKWIKKLMFFLYTIPSSDLCMKFWKFFFGATIVDVGAKKRQTQNFPKKKHKK
jgi:hypothetical protein